MKLLVDMNLSPRWVAALQGAGHEAVHWSQVGDPRAPDATIMSHALVDGFIVLTNDLDFSAILAATNGRGPSVIQLRSDDLNPDAIGRQVLAALRQMQEPLQRGALLTIEPEKTRMRLLPLR